MHDWSEKMVRSATKSITALSKKDSKTEMIINDVRNNSFNTGVNVGSDRMKSIMVLSMFKLYDDGDLFGFDDIIQGINNNIGKISNDKDLMIELDAKLKNHFQNRNK